MRCNKSRPRTKSEDNENEMEGSAIGDRGCIDGGGNGGGVCVNGGRFGSLGGGVVGDNGGGVDNNGKRSAGG